MRSNDWFWLNHPTIMMRDYYSNVFSFRFSGSASSSSQSSCIVKFSNQMLRSKPSNHLSTILMVFLLVLTQTVSATPLFRPPINRAEISRNQTSASSSIFSSKPNWHDPCGLKHQGQFRNRHKNPYINYVTPSDDDLMHNIVNMAKLALRQSRYFKEDYVSTLSQLPYNGHTGHPKFLVRFSSRATRISKPF